MCITFKHNSDLTKLEKKLIPDKLTIVKEVKENFMFLPHESRIQFGHLLFELLMDEFSYIFDEII